MVETKETEKIVIAKPVACRPIAFSKLKSFSTVLSGAVDASPPATFPETSVPIIRPRTGRFKPTFITNSVGAEALDTEASNRSKEVLETRGVSNVVYKPIAKLVSKKTIAFLANLGENGINPSRERAITNIIAPTQPSNQARSQYDLTSNTHRGFPVQSGKNVNNTTLENFENDNKLLTNNAYNRASYDGHNWRKYGQKLVKGSDFPRSYYKCTYTNCPVKKKVEKTLDGQIAEIVYMGEHNHPQPQPQTLDYNNDVATRNRVKNPNQPENENNIESSGQSNFVFSVPPINDQFVAASSNSSLPLSGDCEEVSESLEVNFKSKRTKHKHENQLSKESSIVVERGSSEPRIVVEKNNDPGTSGDGFRWRKYGQKVVKGKIYPRSYYRCTSPKCNVRKYVERMSEDPNNFISTYEGKHNHSAETSKNARTKNKIG
ncbi:hypothetical protein CASFOL_027609 [Castilleja foliolosa]|uniref:WRKY domain-containing protein n=1 Tax=Castilleja foliolosa TaxID=1961234 RepID=A0ABD3CG35_9LAMI